MNITKIYYNYGEKSKIEDKKSIDLFTKIKNQEIKLNEVNHENLCGFGYFSKNFHEHVNNRKKEYLNEIILMLNPIEINLLKVQNT